MANSGFRWVIGLDGSEGSENALRWGLGNVPSPPGTVHLVKAWQYLIAGGAQLTPMSQPDLEPVAVHADLDGIAARCNAAGVELTSAVEYGPTAHVLLDASTDADLLVLGTRGLGGFGRLLLGSTSHQVATHSRVPVAIVPGGATTEGRNGRLVVGVDGSPGACAALRWALRFAASGSTIQVVGALQPSSWGFASSSGSEDRDRSRSEFDATVDAVLADTPSDHVIERSFADGQASDVLLDAADGAVMVVVGGRGHRGIMGALLGSTATEVLHRSELTTVIIPTPTEETD